MTHPRSVALTLSLIFTLSLTACHQPSLINHQKVRGTGELGPWRREAYLSLNAAHTKTDPKTNTKSRGCQGRAASTWGVLVGVSDYRDERVEDLKGPASDAWLLYHYLTHPRGGRVPASQLKLLINHEASRASVERALSDHLGQACPQDRAIVYFAGHGVPEPGRTEEAFLLTHDSDLSNLVGTALSMKMLPQFLSWRAEGVGELLMLVDACHAGALKMPGERGVKAPQSGARLGALPSAQPSKRAQARSKHINQALSDLNGRLPRWSALSATAPEQVALEGVTRCEALSASGEMRGAEPATTGAFTCALLTALSGGADRDGDRVIRLGELYSDVRGRVSELTGGLQTPTRSGIASDDLPLFELPAEPVVVSVPPLPAVYQGAHPSRYTPYRWGALGLFGLAGLTSIGLSAQARGLTDDLNRFDGRGGSEGAYKALLAERAAAVERAELSYVSAGLTALLALTVGLLEGFDEPEGREQVYNRAPWLKVSPP